MNKPAMSTSTEDPRLLSLIMYVPFEVFKAQLFELLEAGKKRICEAADLHPELTGVFSADKVSASWTYNPNPKRDSLVRLFIYWRKP